MYVMNIWICTYIVHCNKINNLEVIILLHYLWNSSKIFIHAIHFFNPFLCWPYGWNIQKKQKLLGKFSWNALHKGVRENCVILQLIAVLADSFLKEIPKQKPLAAQCGRIKCQNLKIRGFPELPELTVPTIILLAELAL